MATDCWVMDSNGWCYIGASGYVTPHKNDNCWHNFSEATYTDPATCSKCGVTNGEAKEVSITLQGSEPIYTRWYNYTQMKITNLYYRVTESGYVYVYFDVEKIADPDNDGDYIAARFKLFDDEGYLIDDSSWAESDLYIGDRLYGEYITLDLDYWDGQGELYLQIIDYT